MKTGIELIAEERERQIKKENWTPQHDDSHDHGELAAAAAVYAMGFSFGYANGYFTDVGFEDQIRITSAWPFKEPPKFNELRKRDLQKAGALIAAELDRLQRLTEKSK